MRSSARLVAPATLSFADVTIEVRDGLRSRVEGHPVTSPPSRRWSAKVAGTVPKVGP